MNIESIREYCLVKPGVTESFPFDEDTLVFKVMGKMFCLMSLEDNCRMNLKCDPDYAVELREQYEGEIIPGWHMNKTNWNTVYFNGSLRDELLRQLIDLSYDLVIATLKKKDREALEGME